MSTPALRPSVSPTRLFWRRLRRDRFALGALGLLGLLVVFALAAPLIAEATGHSANQAFVDELDAYGLPPGPSAAFPFGLDTAGRDVLVRSAYGARTSIIVALIATSIAVLLGVVVGLASGYYRGFVDTVLSRAVEVTLALPVLLLAVGVMSACSSRNGCFGGAVKPGVGLVGVVIGLFSWPFIARIVRGQVLSLRERDFVTAARGVGASDARIMLKHLLPNVAAPVIVYATLLAPTIVLAEASLSFLGAGVPPSTPSLGRMLFDAASIFTTAWWLFAFPGLILFALTFAFNIVGDAVRDALDPRTGLGARPVRPTEQTQ